MTFRKLQRFLAAGVVTTMITGTVASAAPINVSKVTSKVAAAVTTTETSEKTDDSTTNGVSANDEGVYKVTMDDTGYITADSEYAANESTPFSWDNVNVYFVFTDRFYNGDKTNDHSYGRSGTSSTVPAAYKSTFEKVAGSYASTGEMNASSYETRKGTFHGGDLKGMTQKIEDGYFDDLGTNAIWITAPYEQIHGGMSGSGYKYYAYTGYWTLDFTNVDANMGTADDLKNFVTAAHKHGIRVIFDVVMNHAGYAEPYTATEYGIGSMASNWRETYFGKSESSYTWKDDYVTYGGMMNSTGWLTGWWGTSWVRMVKQNGDGTDRFTEYDGAESGDEIKLCTGGLPDFKTESGAVSLPDILKNKWTAEGNYDEKVKMTEASLSAAGLSEKSVSNYLVAWLSEWVRDYGIDGFRCDTAKHVELANWNKLYKACNSALAEWRKNNPKEPGAAWKDDFWMTGEAWGWSSKSKDAYFTQGGFNSMINFGYQKNETKTGASLESVFSEYASAVNGTADDGFNILSYISSHDKGVGARSAGAGTALLLTPGGVQTYYGDESGRSGGQQYAEGDPESRSQMNWSSTDTAILSNWQKVGRFRRDHIAVGAGQHKQISDSDVYTFSRTYEGKVQGQDYTDKVVIALPAKAGTFSIGVGDIFEEGESVTDAYSGEVYAVSGGKVSATCDSNGVILLEGSGEVKASVSASSAGKTYDTDTYTVTLAATKAKDTYYQIGDGDKQAFADGDKITIGGDTAYGEKTTIKLTGVSEDDGSAVSKEVSYTRGAEPVVGVASSFKVRVSKSDFTSAPYIYAYGGSGAAAKTYTAKWPGDTMTEEGDYYVFANADTTSATIIMSQGSWRSTPDGVGGLEATGTMDYDKTSGKLTAYTEQAGEAAKVTINYIDQATEKTMKSIYRVGVVGDAYTTYESSFAGYKLVEKPNNATGKFTADAITVNYYYTNGDTPVTIPPTSTVTPSTTAPSTLTPSTTAPSTLTPSTTAPVTLTPSTTTPPTKTPSAAPATITPSPTAPETEAPAEELSVKEFTASVDSPQTLGKTVTFKAAAKGGSGSYEYRFDIARIVNAVAIPALKQAYAATDTLKWTPEIAGNYTVTVRVKDTKTGNIKTASMEYVVKAKSIVSDDEKLSITKFSIAHTTGKYAVKLYAAATGGTGAKQFKFVRVYTSSGKTKYKTLKSYSTSKTTTWKASKKGTYKFRVYVKDKNGLKVQVTRTFKITK